MLQLTHRPLRLPRAAAILALALVAALIAPPRDRAPAVKAGLLTLHRAKGCRFQRRRAGAGLRPPAGVDVRPG